MAKFPNIIISLLVLWLSLGLFCSCDNKASTAQSVQTIDTTEETIQVETPNQEISPINPTPEETLISSDGDNLDNDKGLQELSSKREDTANSSTPRSANKSTSSQPVQRANNNTSKRALVIGIGHYQDDTWSDIHGDADVPLVVKMLRQNGYKDIRTLVNEQATKNRIVKEFSSLKSRSNQGDIVYIHFSGHGQQMTDINGDEKDEKDNLDEAWIPYDAQYAYSDTYHGENHLVDDEIGIYLSEISDKLGAEGKLLVVVDACHSGGSVKGSALDELRAEPDIFIRGTDDIFEIPFTERTGAQTKAPMPKIQEKWLTLTACKDFEVNFEIKTQQGYYGMLTYALFHNYDKFKSKDNKGIQKIIQDFMDMNCPTFLPQNHQLSGVTDTVLLYKFF